MSEPESKLTAATKRFRFGLRLLFLVVALLGTFFAWRRAVEQKHWAERDIQRTHLESELGRLEKWSAEGHINLQESKDSAFNQKLATNLKRIDSDIDKLKQKLKELEK